MYCYIPSGDNFKSSFQCIFLLLLSLKWITESRKCRNISKSFCLLATNEEDTDKLDILTKSEDGFVIAEEDMKQRGPGELAGTRQAGIPDFAFLNVVDDYKIFVVARDDAKEILKHKDEKKYQWLIKHATSLINQEDIKKA